LCWERIGVCIVGEAREKGDAQLAFCVSNRGRVELLSCCCRSREIGENWGCIEVKERGLCANSRGKLGLHCRSKRRNVCG